jgi:ribonuclease HI
LNALSIKPPPTITPQPLEDFLSRHGIVHGQWDLLLFGDGSGMSWDMGGGFAAVLVDGRSGIRSHIVGAQTLTTINRMELGAYIHILAYHYEFLMNSQIADPPYRTFIFTDSEFTMKAGRKTIITQKNLDLWHTVNWFELQGYRFDWRGVPRNSTPYHELVDYLAGTARYAINAVDLEGDRLHSLMPYSKQLAVDVQLTECLVCHTPLTAAGDRCPICGPIRKD